MAGIISTQASQTRLQKASPLGFANGVDELEHQFDQLFFQPLLDATEGADLIIAHPLLGDRVAAIAEYRKIVHLPYDTVPMFRTRAFSPPVMGAPPLGPLTGLAHSFYQRILWRAQKEFANDWRKKIGVRPATRAFISECEANRWSALQVYSSTLSPRPADWGNERVMTGLVRVPKALRAALERTLGMRERAREVAKQIDAEDGHAQLAAHVEGAMLAAAR